MSVPQAMTPDDAHDLARVLVLDLAEVHGDPGHVGAVLNDWLADHEPLEFLYVTAAALQHVFVDCLHEPGNQPGPDDPAPAFNPQEAPDEH